MKFMKLGSKPDQFQTDGDNIRYVATELATDIIVNVGDVKFYLHKFPLLSKSSRLQKLVADTNQEDDDEINIHDIPGGPASFETCAKFCYGMVVTLNAHNIVAARCAAEYLEMYETVEKGNLIHKIDVFLSSCILRSWKDSIIALQTTRSYLPWSEDLKIISHCLDSITAKACTDPSKVDWSYSYNHKKLSSENGKKHDPSWNGVKKQHAVTKDWWVEDLCELQIDLYKRVITAIKAKGRVSNDVIGESLNAYASRRLPIFSKSTMQGVDVRKYRYLVETLVHLMPGEKNSAPCSFLLKLLQASIMLECGENTTSGLTQRIAQQLDEASVADFLIDCQNGEMALYSIDLVQNLVEQFLMREHSGQNDDLINPEFQEMSGELSSDASKTKVARLVDGYLAEASRDPSLPLSKFLDLAHLVSGFPRATHDGIYRAVDMYLKEHSEITKSEKKRICRLMDCKKLSPEACAHAVQNERLPLRVVVQVLFFEQARAASNNGNSTPDLSGSMRTVIPSGSFGSSRTGTTTTNTDEDWEGEQATSEDLKGLKRELASLKLRKNEGEKLNAFDKVAAGKKGTKIFSRIWSGKERRGGESSNSSDTCESPASTSAEEIIRCTPLRKY